LIEVERHKKYLELADLARQLAEEIIPKISKVLPGDYDGECLSIDMQCFVGHFLTILNSQLITPLIEDDENMPLSEFLDTLRKATENALTF
jgi:hypothetical protein